MTQPQIYTHRTIYGRLRSIGTKTTEYLTLMKQASKRDLGPTEGPVHRKVTDHFEHKSEQEIIEESRFLMECADDGTGQMARIIPNVKGQWWCQALRSLDKCSQPDPSGDLEWAEWRRFVTAQCFDLTKVASTLLMRKAFGDDAKGSREDLEAFIRSLGPQELEERLSSHVAPNNDGFFVQGLSLGDESRYDVRGDLVQIMGNYPEAYVAALPGKELEAVFEHPTIAGSGVKILHAECDGRTLILETNAHDEENTVSYVHDPKGLLAI